MVVEKRIQCRVRKLKKDRDFVQFKKKVYRFPKVFKRKFTSELRVVDLQFDILNLEFKRLKRLVDCLLKNCEWFWNSVECSVDRSLNLSRLFEYVLGYCEQSKHTQFDISSIWRFREMSGDTKSSEVGIIWPLSSPAGPKSFEGGNFSAGSRIILNIAQSREKSMRRLIDEKLKMFNAKVLQPLRILLNLFTQIGRILKERKLCMIDLTTYISKYRRLSSTMRKPLRPRQVRKKMRYERDAELQKLKYESLTAAIKIELRALFTLFREFFRNWTANYLLTTFSLAFTLYDKLGDRAKVSPMSSDNGTTGKVPTCEPLNTGVSSRFNDPLVGISEGLESVTETVTRFRSNFDAVERRLRNLQLIKFDSSSHSGAKKTVSVLYVTAMYDYTRLDAGFNLGDLSFRCGDLIKVVLKDESGWWLGVHCNTNERGIFPANYVKKEERSDDRGSSS
ncbi:BAR and SH3 domains-containing protein LALA0_S03e08328g [Lachancea lanzarotensis]|uniref:LALA0S03e08328g1_1 n=1 Tax=Lachancea lanzarotensis TaxID=1245769 RepID=A0A0C7MVS9_9SACH|nr:uncharacterized protein LALA0_S03e08328g [Lachancea lanzarotensis]CEP61678.1 LALA0S03e08328g1_1 [Lachancea lanzarotensis]